MGLGIFRNVPQRLGAIEAHQFFEIVLVTPVAGVDLPAIAPGGARADFGSFQHNHRKTALGEGQRRAEAGITRADNADIGAHIALKRRLRR